jgi:protein SCO1/2
MIKKQLVKQISKLSLFLAIFLVFISCVDDEVNQRVLPIVGERDVVYKTVNGEELVDTIYHHVPEFRYINQDSVWVKSTELKEKIWVADFFFSHCPSICPPMTSNMKRLAVNTKDLENHVQFLSFSIDPERDTPTRLQEYIQQYGIKSNNWLFLTGKPEDETHLLAKEFFNGAERNDEIDGGFGHTSYFVIVDKEGLVRGIYDGTDSEKVDELESDLRKLLKHEYNIDGSK